MVSSVVIALLSRMAPTIAMAKAAADAGDAGSSMLRKSPAMMSMGTARRSVGAVRNARDLLYHAL